MSETPTDYDEEEWAGDLTVEDLVRCNTGFSNSIAAGYQALQQKREIDLEEKRKRIEGNSKGSLAKFFERMIGHNGKYE